MSDPILSLHDLHVHFTATHGLLHRTTTTTRAVNGIDLAIQPGEIIGLVGESGCGKSTLIRAILQLIRPTSGQVIYDGQDLTTMGNRDLRAIRRHLQIVFQDPYASLNPRLKIGQAIAEPLINLGIARGQDAQQRVDKLMQLVGLPPAWSHGYPHEFSGGQRQRIAIARALAPEPKILFCDEPVSALDVSIQAQIINLITDLQRQLGLTVVFISHDLSVVRHLADRVAVMYLGKIVELAPADQLYTAPAHPYTQALLSAVPIPNPATEHQRQRLLLTGDPPSPDTPRQGCDFATRCPIAQPNCKTQIPPLDSLTPTHATACHYPVIEA